METSTFKVIPLQVLFEDTDTGTTKFKFHDHVPVFLFYFLSLPVVNWVVLIPLGVKITSKCDCSLSALH